MKPFSKILIPVDFSVHSAEAIQVASDISRRYQAPATVVHVQQLQSYALPDGFLLYTPAQLNEMTALFEKQLEQAREDARVAGAVEVKSELVLGAPFVEIVRLAREGAYDLIVMGTHGRTGLKHALLGSVAEKVVRKAPCAVLTVRQTEQHFEHP